MKLNDLFPSTLSMFKCESYLNSSLLCVEFTIVILSLFKTE